MASLFFKFNLQLLSSRFCPLCSSNRYPDNCLIADGDNNCSVCKTSYKLSGGSCVLDIEYTTHNGLQILRANAGDSGGAPIPDGVVATDVGQSCTPNAIQPCCWVGATSSTNCDTTSSTTVKGKTYSGCNRTVCDWYAAKRICESIGWRLPTYAEALYWRRDISTNTTLITQLAGTSSSSLGLCDDTASYGAPRCASTSSCPGSTSSTCAPRYIWLEDDHNFYLSKGLFTSVNSATKTYAYSVRCVK